MSTFHSIHLLAAVPSKERTLLGIKMRMSSSPSMATELSSTPPLPCTPTSTTSSQLYSSSNGNSPTIATTTTQISPRRSRLTSSSGTSTAKMLSNNGTSAEDEVLDQISKDVSHRTICNAFSQIHLFAARDMSNPIVALWDAVIFKLAHSICRFHLSFSPQSLKAFFNRSVARWM